MPGPVVLGLGWGSGWGWDWDWGWGYDAGLGERSGLDDLDPVPVEVVVGLQLIGPWQSGVMALLLIRPLFRRRRAQSMLS